MLNILTYSPPLQYMQEVEEEEEDEELEEEETDPAVLLRTARDAMRGDDVAAVEASITALKDGALLSDKQLQQLVLVAASTGE